MDTEQKQEGNQQNTGSDPATWLKERMVAKYHEVKKHAETYPYVWASYAVVYGGIGLWYAYRWIKLRNTEDRVRALHQRLEGLAQNNEAASSKSSTLEKPSGATHVDKPSN